VRERERERKKLVCEKRSDDYRERRLTKTGR
jgi:hypothetical protein